MSEEDRGFLACVVCRKPAPFPHTTVDWACDPCFEKAKAEVEADREKRTAVRLEKKGYLIGGEEG